MGRPVMSVPSGIVLLLGAILAGMVFAPACGGDSKSSRASIAAPDEGGGETAARTQERPPPTPAEFGLDRRPSNTTCRAPARPPAGAAVKLEPVFQGVTLDTAMALAQAPGDRHRWFVAQRGGLVVSFPVENPPATPAVVADVARLSGKPIVTEIEGGLLNLAFDPRFADNGRLFVSFTTTGSPYASEVGYLTSTDGGSTFGSYTQVLRFDRPNMFHDGGGMAFDNDGLLFLSFGTPPTINGQSRTGFHSKVLRIDVHDVPPGQSYGIPDGNPFKNGGGEPAVFAWGFRNPYRISVDRGTNELWVGDVGDAAWEEIDRVQAGANYGWPCREGAHVNPATRVTCPPTGLTDPVFEHDHASAGGRRAIIGGVVYRGAAMPWLHGTYVYGDYAALQAWALSFDGATGQPRSVLLTEQGPSRTFTHFAEDADGEIYASTVYQSQIYKLVPAGAVVESTFPDRLSKTGCVDPGDPTRPLDGLIPYGVNAELWSDGATKERFFAIPDGTTVNVGPDGDLELPVGSVTMKTFFVGGKRVETRLLVRHDDGEWAGYTYEWGDDPSDAVLLHAGKSKAAGDQTWTFPSRSECLQCHTTAAGRTLGPELAQLDGDLVYATTNRISNQLKTLVHIGVLAGPLPAASTSAALPDPFGDAPLERRARAYRHANCSMCHRPEGGPRAELDLRSSTAFADTRTCGTRPLLGDLGLADARVVSPGHPESSVMSLRMHATDARRMPPLGTRRVDARGTALIDEWIRGVRCP